VELEKMPAPEKQGVPGSNPEIIFLAIKFAVFEMLIATYLMINTIVILSF